MGYSLSSIGNLPIQENILLYIFIIENGWRGDLSESLRANFDSLAERLGQNAIIARGFNPEEWSSQVFASYLVDQRKLSPKYIPALLITDSHPEKQKADSLRLFIPLTEASTRFGGIETFFQELVEFSQNRNSTFLDKFEDKTNALEAVWSFLELKPNLFGFGINIKELIARMQGK